MALILLDSTPLGLAAHPSQQSRIEPWIRSLAEAGNVLCVPEIIYYEVRRELERLELGSALALLEGLREQLRYIAMDTPTFIRGAKLWGSARRAGRPTADDSSLDIDVLLAATALELAEREGEQVIVATSNVRHLSQFVDARLWETVA